MTVTRAQVETLLVRRAAKRMIFVGMDGVTITGANADLHDPIATALLALGITPLDFTAPADGDLVSIAGDSLSELLDRAELRLLENIMGNVDTVDISEGPRSESFSQFGRDLETIIKRKQARIDNAYGGGLGSLSGGFVSTNFQSKADDVFFEEM